MSQLTIYNGALLLLREKKLSALGDDAKSRRLLDEVWDKGGVRYCLARAPWTFATKTDQVDFNPSYSPNFGYRKAFNKPTDWVLTVQLCQDEYFSSPLIHYEDEADFWFCDLETIYVRYVSDDANYGLDYAKWTNSFNEYVEAYFASKIVTALTENKQLIEYIIGPVNMPHRGLVEKALSIAKNENAQGQPPRFKPEGNWNRARHFGRGRRDRGNRGNLIG